MTPLVSSKRTFVMRITTLLLLSWMFAACEQIIHPIPFSPVPVILAPLHLYIATHFFGWVAVQAFALYLLQGALGAPFFAWGAGGITRLMGPTGGYLFGMLLAMVIVQLLKNRLPRIVTLTLATIVLFACGLTQLSFFVPAHALLAAGLYPFIVGEVVKIALALILTRAK